MYLFVHESIFGNVFTKKWHFIPIITGIIGSYFTMTGQVVKGVETVGIIKNWTVIGDQFFIYFFHYLPLTHGSLILLWVNLRKAHGIKREQLKWLLISLTICLAGAWTTFMPGWGLKVEPHGFHFIFLLQFAIGYTILKHEFLDVRLTLSKMGSIFATSFMFLIVGGYAFYFFFLITNQSVAHVDLAVYSVILGVLVGMSFGRLRILLQTTVFKRFLKGRYDYKEVLLKFSTALAETSELKQILSVISTMLREEIEVSKVSLLLPPQYSAEESDTEEVLAESFVMWDLDTQSPLSKVFASGSVLYDEIMSNPQQTIIMKNDLPKELKAELKALNAVMIIPCVRLSTVEGVIVLQPKLTEDRYSPDDNQLLVTLSVQLATALNRIKPFEQIKKDYQRSLAFAEKASQQATFAKLTMGIAHEIRNPITILKSSAKLLERLWLFKPLTPEDFMPLLNNQEKAEALFQELIAKDYLDAEGFPTKKLDVLSRRFTFELSEDWDPYKDAILNSLKDYFKTVELKKFLDLVYKSVNRVVDIAETMLKYGKADSKDRHLLPVSNLMKDLVIMIEGEVNKRDVHIEEAYSDIKEMVFGDETRLNQALINVTMNALQALEKVSDGSSKTLTLRTSSKTFLNGLGKEVRGVEISIEDTGCGISEENLAKIYDPFFSTKDKSGGKNVGLGLSILQQIIKDHDGVIEVVSELGKGTQFKIYLPYAIASSH